MFFENLRPFSFSAYFKARYLLAKASAPARRKKKCNLPYRVLCKRPLSGNWLLISSTMDANVSAADLNTTRIILFWVNKSTAFGNYESSRKTTIGINWFCRVLYFVLPIRRGNAIQHERVGSVKVENKTIHKFGGGGSSFLQYSARRI